MMKKHLPILILFIAAAIWGFAFVSQKELSQIPVLTTMSIRNLLASLFLFLVIPLMDKILKSGRRFIQKGKLDFTKSELIGGVTCGAILAVASTLQQFGIAGDTDAGKAAFISALYVLFVPVFSLFIKKRTSANAWCGALIATVGFYLLCIKEGFSVIASDLFVLACSAIFAIHILSISHFSPKCDGVRLSCIQFATAFILIAPLSLILEGLPEPSEIYSVLPSLLFFGICSGGLAYTLQIIGQGYVEPSIASIILSLESVFGAIGGAIVLGERMTPKEYIGSLVILVAVLVSQLDFGKLATAIRKRQKENKNKKQKEGTENE